MVKIIQNKVCLKINDDRIKNIIDEFYINKNLDINIIIKDNNYNDNDIINFANYNYIKLLIILDIKKSDRIVKENEIEIIYNEKYNKSFQLANEIKNNCQKEYKCDLKRKNKVLLLNKANMISLIIKIDESIIYDNNTYDNILNNIKKFIKGEV